MRQTIILLLVSLFLACFPYPGNGQVLCDRELALKSLREGMYNPPKDTAVIVFIGDVMMHSAQIAGALQEDGTYRFDGCLDHIVPMLSEADVAVANLEFTLAGKPYTGYPCFSAPDSYPNYVADCGVDIFLTANNHILDKGSKGLARTIVIYEKMKMERGILYTGCGMDKETFERINPLYIRLKGIKTALINFTYGTNLSGQDAYPAVLRQSDKTGIRNAIQKARNEGAELIIALPHWGQEYVHRHSKYQEEMALWLVQQGVDLIIGAHPHFVQDRGAFCQEDEGQKKRTEVIYSLGNAISNMSATDTQVELIARVRVTRDEAGKAVVLPVELEYLWCSLPGRFSGKHTVIPVKEYIDRPEAWLSKYDYDKMIQSINRTANATGIPFNK
ncbi:MAG: CapA family protein [Candidatus Cryptobacteroides sp.]